MELITGIGLTLLGSGLPALAALWRLDDASSGRLLLAVFAGSAIGALLVRSPFHRTLAAGMAMIATSMAGLALSGGHGLFFLFLLFGTGLGLAMTANSVLTGDRYRERRAAMLTLLNFSWSAGSAVSPFAVQLVIHHAGVGGLFWCMAAAGILSTILALCLKDRRTAAAQEVSRRASAVGLQSSRRVGVFFAVFGLLYCGTEAALGGWVLTYVHRLHFQISAAPPLAASCFWLSLLIGRAIAPAVLLRIREELVLAVALICAFAGVAALLTLHSLPAVMLSAAVAGLSMAPIFPICVSIFMALTSDPAQTRWMFAVAGLGSATLPWATGQLAAGTGSLQTGLLVPLLALGLMLLMMRWPGGGTDLFRSIFRAPEEQPLPPSGPTAVPSL
ncbi:MAG: transporter, family, glucose/mannose:H+ symporter [Acidobacteriaceae bacterium]|jgi:fucose permease|nr:transporter, family, glucose/mannose:H+ symporter [Acidobacteriaceae bacterium]